MNSFDFNILRFISKLQCEFLNNFLKFITYLGNVGFIFIITGIILLLFKKTRKQGLIALISILIGGILSEIILKNIIQRPRPFQREIELVNMWWINAGKIYESSYSMPSGHTTCSMAFTMGIIFTSKSKKTLFLLIVPIIMGFSRLYFMVHHPTDVFMGLLVGFVSSLLVFLGYKFIKKNEILIN